MRRARALFGQLGRVLCYAGLVLVILVVLAVGWVALRIVLYAQHDDAAAVARKEAYLAGIAASHAAGAPETRPNVVLILFDDMGYGDLSIYGSTAIATPSLDAMARGGVLFRNGYAPSPYCSASRAGILTGRFPVRSGMDHVVQSPGSFTDVLERFGGLNRRLPLEEVTLAEVLSAAGYATALIGKWHLGDTSPSLPNERGFEHFFGLLHSNDQGKPPLWRDGEVVEPHPVAQSTLTVRYTDEAVRFLEASRNRPFFLYLAHTFPHIPLHASEAFRGRSAGGLYGDVVEELDWSVGRVLETLDRLGLRERTLVVVTSDNGPWFQGSSGGARGRKFDVFEGGTRVPFLASWPGRIPDRLVVEEPVSAIDLFPTVLAAVGLPEPDDRVIDGHDLWPVLSAAADPAASPAERVIYFFQLGVLRAVRSGRFKYHEPHYVVFGNPMNWAWSPNRERGPWLFDLATDPGEVYDVSARYPTEVKRLRLLLEEQRDAIERDPRGFAD